MGSLEYENMQWQYEQNEISFLSTLIYIFDSDQLQAPWIEDGGECPGVRSTFLRGFVGTELCEGRSAKEGEEKFDEDGQSSGKSSVLAAIIGIPFPLMWLYRLV
jgi:hypothetical protein